MRFTAHFFMTKIIDILRSEYSSEYSNDYYVKQYSKPKIYPKIVTTKPLSAFTKADKEAIMKKHKRWYIYYSFLNPSTGEMKRQPAIYFNINRRYSDFDDRLKNIKLLRKSIENLLKRGFSPYEGELNTEMYTAESALNFALSLKRKTLKGKSYQDYENRLSHFKKFLNKKGILKSNIEDIDRRTINSFLNEILNSSSPRNRNNTKTVLSALFTVLEDNDLIKRNFIKNIKSLNTKPKKNKAFTTEEVEAIFKLLKRKDKWLYYYYSHVYYALFRPIEVARIQIKHINLENQLIESNTKTGDYYKQIPNILIEEFYSKVDLKLFDKEYLLFTKTDSPSFWETKEENRREYFWKRLKRIIKPETKKEDLGFELTNEHTSYSFRHAAIGKLFIEKIQENRKNKIPNFEENALNYIRTITLHKSNDIVRDYLREIGYFKIDDWSNYLK